MRGHDGGAGEDGSEFAIAAGGSAEAAGALDGVGGVEDDGEEADAAYDVPRV